MTFVFISISLYIFLFDSSDLFHLSYYTVRFLFLLICHGARPVPALRLRCAISGADCLRKGVRIKRVREGVRKCARKGGH